ncbi:PHB depolymerase family esterase [uncultured Thiothrix sp.]|uniref:extracellular catalytic domain type 1 short-chain-length polyhydroxyalkanoate depolymerase n=1 Tax=uncultured Thiothrix sp. TaxID=223185 RepID=UPI00261DEDDE|nr:PHB depolymerase family esterase [uncultured Thiothrix sp.]
MKARFLNSMQEALGLVRSGQLQQATQLIHQSLRRDLRQGGRAANETNDNVIEAQFVRKSNQPASEPLKPAETAQIAESFEQVAKPSFGQEAQFLTRNFSNEHGSRDYKLYIPSSYTDQPLPLVVMLHGCTQNAEDFALGTAMNQFAEQYGVLVAYPTQAKSANSKGCWNWYKVKNQQADRGEPALIAGLTRAIMQNHHVDSKRVYVAGLSAGGAMAVIMGATYPDLYAAVGVHSGLAAGSATNVIAALAAMRQGSRSIQATGQYPSFVPTIVFHGDQDPIVNLKNAEQVFAQAKQRLEASNDTYFNTEQVTVNPAGSRAYTRTQMKDENGQTQIDYWLVHGAGHAWSGGEVRGSYVDPTGPKASEEILGFFLKHSQIS